MLASTMKMLEPVQPVRKPRCRVVRGTHPNTFGHVARRTATKPGYQLYQESVIRYRQYAESKEEDTFKQTLISNHITWEDITEKKMVASAVKRKVHCKFEEEEKQLEERQLRLKKLLSDEENALFNEIESVPLTMEQQKESMRQRAKQLREKREEERQKLVQEKLDQKFRSECDPLRTATSKRLVQEIAAEHRRNADKLEIMRKEKQMVDDIFREMSQKEYQKMLEKEEKENKERKTRNEEVANVLREQMAELEENKCREEKLKEEELKLLKEQAILDEMKEKRSLEEKRRLQKETRNIFEKSIKEKLQRKAEDEQEELEYDIKALQALLEKCGEEDRQKQQRKLECQKETQSYLKYVRSLLAEEEARKKEMERMIQEDIENQWQKRLKQWRLDREMRRVLMDDVFRIRSRQVMDKLVAINMERAEAEKEKEQVLGEIEWLKEKEAEEIQKERQKKLQYFQDLRGQIEFNTAHQEILKNLEEDSYKKELQAEEDLKAKVENLLKSNVSLCKQEHPLRRALSQVC
ncbi:cilia- and flagella-associated protein 53 [Octopus bimaculoides]|uniref:Cilia- and flagella-associated protein 53 n=1 Tax=Octopus bimaculoides TaxID=37653 RepID=A0A0L8GW52_OCTBM|nr:cilia- and flagella-associated protein 53 [Octopus bimaculoides]|eukprot:XP_014777654.1 PREDICTED: cilia- and flagella-associated protein 53-like [Octopus bimaculoides]